MKRILLATLLLAACGGNDAARSGQPSEDASQSVIAEAPPAQGLYDLSLPELDGDTLHLSTYRGQHLLVNFWATWCAPCRQEIPDLNALQETYGTRGLEIVGISMDVVVEGDDLVSAFVEEYDITYPIVMGDQRAADAMGGMFGLPTSFLFAPDGTLIRRFTGLIPMADIEPFLDSILPESRT